MKCLPENFISESGIIIPKTQVQYENCGNNSNIWKYEKDGKTYAFKEFFDDRRCYCLGYDEYQKMRELPLQNIVRALEGYKKVSNTHEKSIDGYLMEYIPSNEDFSPIDYPIAALLESIESLESDVSILTGAHITMHAVGPRNSIVQKDNFKLNIIDTDMYYYNKFLTDSEVANENRRNIFNLVRLLLFRGLIYCEELDEKRTDIRAFLDEYFDSKETKQSLVTRVDKLFGNYETPKQYFLEKHINK